MCKRGNVILLVYIKTNSCRLVLGFVQTIQQLPTIDHFSDRFLNLFFKIILISINLKYHFIYTSVICACLRQMGEIE